MSDREPGPTPVDVLRGAQEQEKYQLARYQENLERSIRSVGSIQESVNATHLRILELEAAIAKLEKA